MSDPKAESAAFTALDWTVRGMDCATCATKIRGAVERLPGVSDVEIGVVSERLNLRLDPSRTAPESVKSAIERLGYKVEPRPAKAQASGVPILKRAAPQAQADSSYQSSATQGGAIAAVPGANAAIEAGPSTGPAASVGMTQVAEREASDDDDLDPADRDKFWYQTNKGRVVIFTALLLAAAWGSKFVASEKTATWAFVAACLIGVAPVARRAFAALRAGLPFTIEMLMTIAAVGALFINAAEEAALVVFLFAVGEVLEGVAANRARSSIRALASLVPKTALLEVNGATRQVDAAALQIGQTVLVRPGDRVPADGTVLDGTSGVDESPVTGESVPRTKGPGDDVFAGSINTEAALRVSVTRATEDNTISRIIRLVEEAESARAPTERFIDRFSRIYMPAVVGVALLVVLVPPLAFGQDWGTWVYRGLALLLIGCPCALVISVPASIASALSAGARRGLLMKGGAVIEATAKTTRVAFDKTGTLTVGRPQVTDVVPFGADERELLAVAAGVEAGSSHPLATAILARAEKAGVAPLIASEAKNIVGKGAEAQVGGSPAWVGSARFAKERGAMSAEVAARAADLENQGKTVSVVFRQGKALGLLGLRDEPKDDAVEGIRQLKALGIGTVMLTGDNARTAAAIAGGLGLDQRAELMPEDKVTAIREMAAHGGVMMVGDGINDAPALAQASVGVAMGSGTDVALETADGALLRNRVADVAAQIRLARAAMGNIRQNVALALGLKAVFLVTSVLGITGLWIAILADTGATVLVTLNALRLLSFNPEREI